MHKKKCYSFKAILPFSSSCWVKIPRPWQLEQCRDGRGERKERQLCGRLSKGEAVAPPTPWVPGQPHPPGSPGQPAEGREEEVPDCQTLPSPESGVYFSQELNDMMCYYRFGFHSDSKGEQGVFLQICSSSRLLEKTKTKNALHVKATVLHIKLTSFLGVPETTT